MTADVVELKQPPRLTRYDFCKCVRAEFGSLWQAWSVHEVDEALASPDFFNSMIDQGGIQVGDKIELFQIFPEHKDMPEADPIAMGEAIVKAVHKDAMRRGIEFARIGGTLHYNGDAPAAGIYVGVWGRHSWGSKWWVYKDGRRLASFGTKIEAADEAARLLGVKSFDIPPSPPPGAPTGFRARPEDVMPSGTLKISRTIQVGTILPIADILQDMDYWSLCRDRFRAYDRVSIVRYSHDGDDSTVVETLPLALVDKQDGGLLRFYPRSEIMKTKFAPETGLKVAQHDGMWVVRENGRIRERFMAQDYAQKWFEEHTAVRYGRAC